MNCGPIKSKFEVVELDDTHSCEVCIVRHAILIYFLGDSTKQTYKNDFYDLANMVT